MAKMPMKSKGKMPMKPSKSMVDMMAKKEREKSRKAMGKSKKAY